MLFRSQNGIQKGLFMACKELKIKTVELQHGYVNYTHPAYSYPKLLNVSNEKQINLPYTFITFSEYWSNNIYYPVKEIIPFGNSFYAKNCLQQVTNRKNLTFISADIFQKTIEFYVDSIVDYVSDGCALNIKLHPNQYNTKIDIIQKYEKYPNINVYSDDISINELLSTSKEVIVISSTIAYEALQSNCNLAIIQDDSSFDLIDLFDQPNVRIIHSPSELLLQKKNIKSSVKYFEEFQSDSFSEFLKCN